MKDHIDVLAILRRCLVEVNVHFACVLLSIVRRHLLIDTSEIIFISYQYFDNPLVAVPTDFIQPTANVRKCFGVRHIVDNENASCIAIVLEDEKASVETALEVNRNYRSGDDTKALLTSRIPMSVEIAVHWRRMVKTCDSPNLDFTLMSIDDQCSNLEIDANR